MASAAVSPEVVRLLENARYEVLPTAAAEEKILGHLPLTRTITITASPSRGLEPTLALAERLAVSGYTVVPHLAARMVRDRAELAEIVARLRSAGVRGVFVPGGDAAPHGEFHDALGLLSALAEMGSPFAHVGIAGYPESHPTIHDDVTVQAMWDKRRYATHLVSNLTFSPTALRDWILRVRARGVALPVLLGVPGPVERGKLLAMATRIGVGESTRFLVKNRRLFTRLARPGGFTGERFLSDCAAGWSSADLGVAGLHVYTFNQIAETEAWRTRLLER